MMFQASDLKGNQFLDLLDDDNNIIEPSYVKSELWLKTCAIRAIMNHVLIGKYRFRFFPKKEFKCSYGLYPIESRYYIFYEYGRFNGY